MGSHGMYICQEGGGAGGGGCMWDGLGKSNLICKSQSHKHSDGRQQNMAETMRGPAWPPCRGQHGRGFQGGGVPQEERTYTIPTITLMAGSRT